MVVYIRVDNYINMHALMRLKYKDAVGITIYMLHARKWPLCVDELIKDDCDIVCLKAPCFADVKSLQVFANLLQLAAA